MKSSQGHNAVIIGFLAALWFIAFFIIPAFLYAGAHTVKYIIINWMR